MLKSTDLNHLAVDLNGIMEKKILWGKTSVLVIHSNKKIRRLFQHLMFLLILSKSGLTFK